MNNSKQICVVGVGNTLRSDDGVGIFICSELEKIKLQGLSVITTHQLHIELVEDLKEFDTIIVVDAGKDLTNEVSFYPVIEQKSSSIHSSHNIDATLLFSLLQKLYPSNRSLYICAVQTHSFEFGETLSPLAISNAEKAIHLLTEFIEKSSA